MFETAIKAHLPIIGVKTDDLVNLVPVLQHYAEGRPVRLWTPAAAKQTTNSLHYTLDEALIKPELYRSLLEGEHQLVVVNVEEPNDLIFDAGQLPTPEKFIANFLEEFDLPPNRFSAIKGALAGLSIKAASELVLLAQAHTGELTARAVREMRTIVHGVMPGLSTVDTLLDFYDPPAELSTWLEINAPHFTGKTKAQLVPRGLLLDGPPGTGKTAAAKYVANVLKLPLYRLDITAALDRYVGASEKQVQRVLNMAERESPCVVLLDEVEKLFTENSDTGVTQRILSQLLWWLSEHRSRVFTIMTTNDRAKIVPELYRPGRIDEVIVVEMMGLTQARTFASSVFKAVLGVHPTMAQITVISGAIVAATKKPHTGLIAHGAVQQLVYTAIKTYKWV